MKLIAKFKFYGAPLVVCALFYSCGDENTATLAITNLSDAIVGNPDGNPVTLDSSNTSASTVTNFRTYEGGGGGFGALSLDLRLKKTAGSSLSFGAIQGWQCSSDVLGSYFTLNINGLAGGVSEYVGTFKSRNASRTGIGDNADIVKTVSTEGTASIEISDASADVKVSFNRTTAVNTLAGSNGYIFAWNSSGVTCGKSSTGENVSFVFSVGATTKEKSSPTASADTSLCDSLPTAPTATALVAFSGDELWDCAAPAASTEITDAPYADELEDLGGTDCIEPTNFWADATTSADSCGTTDSVTDMLCNLNFLYAVAAQAEKSVKRSLECKFEGVMAKAKAGDSTITLGSGGQAEAGEFHILDMGLSDAN